MKKLVFSSAIYLVLILFFILLNSCQKDSNESLVEESFAVDQRAHANSAVFPLNSKPFGKSLSQWTEAWWQYVMQFDCAEIPTNDASGSNAAMGQSGPVYFLVGTSGGSANRTVTIPKSKGILFPIITYLNDYPCPDANFQPRQDQTLEEFLKEGAKTTIDMVSNLYVTLDGKPITNVYNYRVATNLFYFTGNPDLASCIDPCITGLKQEATSDGYWIMLKPLSKGKHILHFQGGIPGYGFEVDVNYTIFIL